MKSISTAVILIAFAMSSFTSCSSGSNRDSNTTGATGKSYIINTLENKDIPSDANMLAQSEGTKVKITRDVEAETMNVYVIRGSVKVSEI